MPDGCSHLSNKYSLTSCLKDVPVLVPQGLISSSERAICEESSFVWKNGHFYILVSLKILESKFKFSASFLLEFDMSPGSYVSTSTPSPSNSKLNPRPRFETKDFDAEYVRNPGVGTLASQLPIIKIEDFVSRAIRLFYSVLIKNIGWRAFNFIYCFTSFFDTSENSPGMT